MRVCNALAGAAALALAACAQRPATPPKPDESAVRTALTAEYAKFVAAVNARDTAAMGVMYAQDATWIGPDASTVTGRASINAMAKAQFASVDSMTMGPMVIDRLVVVSDSEAVAFTHSHYTMKLKGKKAEARVNPFADLWKKGADGAWRIAYEINADGPAAPAPAPPATKH